MTTVFNDVIMPESILLADVRGRQIRRNQRAENQAGFMQANIVWQQTLRRYEVGVGPMLPAVWKTLEGLHEVTEGGAYGFLMLDPKDRIVESAEGKLMPFTSEEEVGAIGLGYGVPTYRLYKRYTTLGDSRTKDRRITRPKSTITVYRGGSPVTAGVAAGNVGIDYTTSGALVTFVADDSQVLTSITTGASTVLNFANGSGIVASMAPGMRVYLSGISGTAGAVLNGYSHPITAEGASSLTISTSTAGLSGTSGTAYKYPQASEALAWSGYFYVPVQFETDTIDWTMARAGQFETRLVVADGVALIEVREE